jgi:hypothetical protein
VTIIPKANRYSRIIEAIFVSRYVPGTSEVVFERTDIELEAIKLDIKLPKNIGDIIYSFRYRSDLPVPIIATAHGEKGWVIKPNGIGRYKFVLVNNFDFSPQLMDEIKIPDSTPGVVAKYALSDEQALLARLRYNRLIDIFTGVACYSLQNHLRTSIPGIGQVETDEIYIGVDRRGAHYVFPVQAKGGRDRQSIIQIEQDIALCAHRFPDLICRPIAAQFMEDHVIVLYELRSTDAGVRVTSEKHYRLVTPADVRVDDLIDYARSPM